MRLKPGVTAERANAQLTSLQRSFLETTYKPLLGDDASQMERYRRVLVLLGPVTGGFGPDMHRIAEARVTIWLARVAVILVAVSCLNVAGLMLLRAMRRRREIAVRLALGISGGRLARQLLTESALLAVLGGASALLAVIWGGGWLYNDVTSGFFRATGMRIVQGRAFAESDRNAAGHHCE